DIAAPSALGHRSLDILWSLVIPPSSLSFVRFRRILSVSRFAGRQVIERRIEQQRAQFVNGFAGLRVLHYHLHFVQPADRRGGDRLFPTVERKVVATVAFGLLVDDKAVCPQ